MASDHLSDTELARLAISGREPAHLASCEDCRDAFAQLRTLVLRLQALPDPPDRLLEAATAFYRRRRNLESLLEWLTEDAALRTEARAHPERVLRNAGIEPRPDLVRALREQGRDSGDLARRIAAKHLWL